MATRCNTYLNQPNNNQMNNIEPSKQMNPARQEKLPNSTLVLVLGILSVVTCICYGQGLILGIINLVLARNTSKMHKANPELYTGHGDVKVGRILSIVGIILSALFIAALAISLFYMDPEFLNRIIQENQAFDVQDF